MTVQGHTAGHAQLGLKLVSVASRQRVQADWNCLKFKEASRKSGELDWLGGVLQGGPELRHSIMPKRQGCSKVL